MKAVALSPPPGRPPKVSLGILRSHNRSSFSLSWFAGANRAVLEKCPTETKFYNGLGLAVLMTGCASGTTMALALAYVLQASLLRILPVAMVWTIVILNLDRLLVMTMTRRHLLLGVVPRILISLVIATQISEPLVLRIFQPEIAQQMQLVIQGAEQQSFARASTFFDPRITADQNAIASIQSQENALVAQINEDTFMSNCEAQEQACSLTHELGCGPVCTHYAQLAASARAELDAVKPRNNAEIATLESQIKKMTAAENNQKAKGAATAAAATGLIALSRPRNLQHFVSNPSFG